ncbi:hypothetical protein HPB47_027877 [Ixodes persulcatus]|uniref:Uncharacterized protein n=1 Tax=Ixodes persulcatus TaxID=34615 RepID=A0AC60PX36_IXOPE|nr:hypothetical protein HPB47_027877 [Ixodes persulcatus]
MSVNSPPSKQRKLRLCVFRKDWRSQPEYESWLLPVDDDATAARCTLCASTFTVKFDGVSAVKHHASMQKHKQKSLASKQSAALTKFFAPATSSAEDKVTAAELGTIFHGIKHNYSYLSMDCGSKLASKVFPDSDVACRMRFGRTKMEHLVKDVLAPYAMERIVEKLRPAGRNLPFALSTDASNKGNRKLFPIDVRFYDVNGAGITDALIDFCEQADETSGGISEKMSLYPTLEDMKVDHMIQAQTRPMPSSAPPGAPVPSAPLPYALYPSSGAGEVPGMGDKFQALYPTLDDYMGISLSRDLPSEMTALAVRPPAHVAIPQTGTGASRLSTMVAPVSGSSVGLRRAEVNHGIREVVLCKDQNKKVGLRLESINKGIFVVLVQANSPAAIVGLRFGDQILTIDDEVVAGYSVDKVHNMIRKANPECIVMAVRDRPFERTVNYAQVQHGPHRLRLPRRQDHLAGQGLVGHAERTSHRPPASRGERSERRWHQGSRDHAHHRECRQRRHGDRDAVLYLRPHDQIHLGKHPEEADGPLGSRHISRASIRSDAPTLCSAGRIPD